MLRSLKLSNGFWCGFLIDGVIQNVMMMMCDMFHHRHNQSINVPTAGAQAFLMDYTYGKQAIVHHAGRVEMQPGPTGQRAFRNTEELEIIHFWSPIQRLTNVA
jgi:hypothetical protein